MTRKHISYLLLISAIVLLVAGCSQNENPTTSQGGDQVQFLSKPSVVTRNAAHSQLGSATSYVSGTVTGLVYSIGTGQNPEMLKGPGTLTFHGSIAERIQTLCGYGSSLSSITIPCYDLQYRRYSGGGVICWIYFQNGANKYLVRVGFPNSTYYPNNSGTSTGSFGSTSTITVTFDNKVFEIGGLASKGNGLTWLWAGSNAATTGVSYTILTSP